MENGKLAAQRWGRWRIAAWLIVPTLLLIPAVAMQFTSEVMWDTADFLFMGPLLAVTGLVIELAVRTTDSMAYRVATGIAVLAIFLLIWINLAVGIIGTEDDPANLMFAAVIAIAENP